MQRFSSRQEQSGYSWIDGPVNRALDYLGPINAERSAIDGIILIWRIHTTLSLRLVNRGATTTTLV